MPPYGARRRTSSSATRHWNFNPRAPYGARLPHFFYDAYLLHISILVPRTGHDVITAVRICCVIYFNPRAPYGARLDLVQTAALALWISIHAPLTGRDYNTSGTPPADRHFNPRAPYGARLLSHRFLVCIPRISIHVPRTGHDKVVCYCLVRLIHFNPRAPYGARLPLEQVKIAHMVISTHVPRTGHDVQPKQRVDDGNISTHVPRTGHDHFRRVPVRADLHFNPRAPYGARLMCSECGHSSGSNFNPRAPYGARRLYSYRECVWCDISTHVPRTGHDCAVLGHAADNMDISTHVPRTGHDLRRTDRVSGQSSHFNPRAPYGARRQ